MIILSIDKSRVEEAAKYVTDIHEIASEGCEDSAAFYEKTLSYFNKVVDRTHDDILICTEKDMILGVMALFVEPQEKYVEITKGIYAKENFEEVSMEFYSYLKETYKGFHLDGVYLEKDSKQIAFMKRINAKCISSCATMSLIRENFNYSDENRTIVPLTEKYYESFCKLHDEAHKDVYWTSERLIAKIDKFDILIALDNGKLVGSVVALGYGDKKVDLSFLETHPNHRGRGYGKSLLRKLINDSFQSGTKEFTLEVEIGNTPAEKLYESIGFIKKNNIYTYSIDSL